MSAFALSLMLAATAGASGLEHHEYDGRGLPLVETYGVGTDVTRTDFTWDDEGMPLTRTKGGKQVTFDYGPQGELRSLTQPDGTQWKYGYDARARLNVMTPPTGSVINTQSWVYDGLGRVKVHTDGARSWETHWNNGVATTLLPGGSLGGFSSLTDSRGRLLELSSVAGLSAPSVSTYSFFYDGLDALRVTSEVAAPNSQRLNAHSMYELDSSRRLAAVTGRGDDVSFTYDGDSTRPLTRTHSTGGHVTSHYDALARLNSLQGPWGTTAVSWEPGGQRLTGLQDALVNETFHFDARGRLDSIGNGFGPVRTYGFDDRDNPISESAGGLTRRFGYDDNDRLVATREWDGTLSALTLTADGSRSTETVFPPSTPWGVLPSAPGFLSKKRFDYGPASGALEAVVDITNAASPVPLASWSYDSAGRATSRTSGGSTVSMQWDVFDRLVSGGGARFEYDGLGLRRAAVDGNGTRRFTYVGESLLAEDSAFTASVAGFKVGMGGVRFGHDALGSVVQQASVSASSFASFSAWGKPLSGPQLTDVAFTGHLSESNLPAYDAQQRWLDKDFGVFLSRDSVGASSYLSGPNGMGPHSYANLSPGRYTDPDGRRAPWLSEMPTLDSLEQVESAEWSAFRKVPFVFQALQSMTSSGYVDRALLAQSYRKKMAAAIERAEEGEPVFAVDGPTGVNTDVIFWEAGVGSRTLSGLRDEDGLVRIPTFGDFATASEMRARIATGAHDAVYGSILGSAAYAVADFSGAGVETKNSVANFAASASEFSFAMSGPRQAESVLESTPRLSARSPGPPASRLQRSSLSGRLRSYRRGLTGTASETALWTTEQKTTGLRRAPTSCDQKPKYSPDVAKWLSKGGDVHIDPDGAWVYTDWDGNTVRYVDGYPDFKGAGLVRQSVKIDVKGNYGSDFTDANAAAPLGPILQSSTWHHHQDVKTLQEVDWELHVRFTHSGGVMQKKTNK